MIDFELSHQERLNLNKEAGELIHSFGDGYSIIDEYGREVNTFTDEEEFNRLIEKFRFRHFLIKKLEDAFDKTFKFGEDNVLLVFNNRIENIYWNLPVNEEEVSLFFEYISHTYKQQIVSIHNTNDKDISFDEDHLP